MLYGTTSNTLLYCQQATEISEFRKEELSRVEEIVSLTQIKENQDIPKKTIFFFDLDDTLFDSPYMLGSSAWRRYIKETTKDKTPPANWANWHDFFSYFLVKEYPIKPVETLTPQLIETLKTKGYQVYGLTARERRKWYDTDSSPNLSINIDVITAEQIRKCGIEFSEANCDYLSKANEYFMGVLYANTDLKGDYLEGLMVNQSTENLPSKVIFIDDKKSQVISVTQKLTALGIANEGYIYLASNAKSKKFNSLIAAVQLYYFFKDKKILSDDEALQLGNQSEKTAEIFLQDVIESILRQNAQS